MNDSEHPRRHVTFDVYALRDLTREHDLTLHERWALVILTLGADYRSGKWSGMLSEFAASENMGASPNTARQVLKRLAECGLIRTLRPFNPNVPSVILVVAYPQLRRATSKVDRRVDEAIAQNCAATDEPPQRADVRDDGQAQRAANAQPKRSQNADLRDGEAVTSTDAQARGREEGEVVKLAARGTGDGEGEAPRVRSDWPTVGGVRRAKAGQEPVRPACGLCGEPSSHDTDDGPLCDVCSTLRDDLGARPARQVPPAERRSGMSESHGSRGDRPKEPEGSTP
jgi:hypothetical protein